MKSGQKTYSNGQIIQQETKNYLKYFFKNGKVRAEGPFINNQMEGEWKFYRETGQLWQVGNFKNHHKHGEWARYNKRDEVEYSESFIAGKIVKKKQRKV
jgi:antitoxin component YwqK of YwqJK toxin-antitoxin module